MENLKIYESVRSCPPEALKAIQAGKLKGKSDINPMWRIKTLTEQFGPCGVGWKTTDETFWTTPGAGGEVIAWCSLRLMWFDLESGAWSDPVFGIGGSMMVDTQKGSLSSNDEAFKMAHTDAISVACKALGFAADVYWGQDATKYSQATEDPKKPVEPEKIYCKNCNRPITAVKNRGIVYTQEQIAENAKRTYGAAFCWDCMTMFNQEKANGAS